MRRLILCRPDGRIAATLRDDPTVYLMDPATAKVTGFLRPQWPEDIAEHGGRAISLAFHADGRMAIATGGGHLVALFDPGGRFVARTDKGTYRYTNGLWWIGDALWTTDTNRFMLKRLDPGSLGVVESVTLPSADGARFLGPARRHPAPGPTMAALVRYQGDMTVGRVVVLSRAGIETPLGTELFAPRDLEWLGSDVLATDGRSRSVLRWSADGIPREPFGDTALRERFARGLAERDAVLRNDRLGRMAAALLFACALGCAVRASLLQRRQRAMVPLDLSRLGTPRLGTAELTRRQWEVVAPWFVVALPMFAFTVFDGAGRLRDAFGVIAAPLGFLLAAALSGLAGWLLWRRQRRLLNDPF